MNYKLRTKDQLCEWEHESSGNVTPTYANAKKSNKKMLQKSFSKSQLYFRSHKSRTDRKPSEPNISRKCSIIKLLAKLDTTSPGVDYQGDTANYSLNCVQPIRRTKTSLIHTKMRNYENDDSIEFIKIKNAKSECKPYLISSYRKSLNASQKRIRKQVSSASRSLRKFNRTSINPFSHGNCSLNITKPIKGSSTFPKFYYATHLMNTQLRKTERMMENDSSLQSPPNTISKLCANLMISEQCLIGYLIDFARLANIKVSSTNIPQLLIATSCVVPMHNFLYAYKSLLCKTSEMISKICGCVGIESDGIGLDAVPLNFESYVKLRMLAMNKNASNESKLAFLNSFFFNKSEYIKKEEFLSTIMQIYLNSKDTREKKAFYIGQICSKFNSCVIEENGVKLISKMLVNSLLQKGQNRYIVSILYSLITAYTLSYSRVPKNFY